MTIQNDTLIIINSKKRIQKIYLSLNKDENQEIYYIERYSGQYGGKETAQPIHTIEKGKVKRTVLEQATLEYNSILKKYLDKGYNKLSNIALSYLKIASFNSSTSKQINSNLSF